MTLLEKSALINYNIYFVLFSRVDGFSLTDPCLKKNVGGSITNKADAAVE